MDWNWIPNWWFDRSYYRHWPICWSDIGRGDANFSACSGRGSQSSFTAFLITWAVCIFLTASTSPYSILRTGSRLHYRYGSWWWIWLTYYRYSEPIEHNYRILLHDQSYLQIFINVLLLEVQFLEQGACFHQFFFFTNPIFKLLSVALWSST